MLPTFLINFHKVEDEQDYVAYLSRLGQVPRFFDQLLANARASAAEGIRPPRFAFEGVIDQSRRVVSGAPFDGGADSAGQCGDQPRFPEQRYGPQLPLPLLENKSMIW